MTIIEVTQITKYKLDTDDYMWQDTKPNSDMPTDTELEELLDLIADGEEDNPDDNVTVTITHKVVQA